jgi:lipid-binding SYLF domain-containing protein
MFSNQAAGSALSVTKRLLTCLVPSLLFVTLAWGADKSKDEETLRNASTVLSAMLESNSVPSDLLAKADCVVVLPGVKKGGFIVGGSGGRGPMSCREGKDFTGKWSAPAMYSVSSASVGLQIGGSSTDFVLLVMTQKGVDALLQGKTTLGSNASAAAGPSGATTTSIGTDILTYGRAKGLFAGAALGGAALEADNDANQRLYDKAITANDILMKNAVQVTSGGQSLVSLLNSKVPKHSE